jgi:hypothetical protein
MGVGVRRGEALTPAITDLADSFVLVKEAVEDIPGLPEWMDMSGSSNPLSKALHDMGAAARLLTKDYDVLDTAGEMLVAQTINQVVVLRDNIVTMVDQALATAAAKRENALNYTELKKLNTQYDDLGPAIDATTEGLEDQEQAAKDARGALRHMADTTYDVYDAEADLYDKIESANEVLADQGSNLFDVRGALVDVARQADETAAAQVELAGLTLDSAEGTQLWTDKMIATANTLEGPMRDAVIDHISRVTGIPTSVLTTFKVSAPDLAAIEDSLNWTARARSVRFDAVGGIPRYAHGTSNHPGGLAIVGDGGGPELVDLPPGSKVHTASETRQMLSSPPAIGGSRSAPVVHIDHFHAEDRTDLEALAAAINARMMM